MGDGGIAPDTKGKPGAGQKLQLQVVLPRENLHHIVLWGLPCTPTCLLRSAQRRGHQGSESPTRPCLV